MIVIYKEFTSLIAKIKLYMFKNVYRYKMKYTIFLGGSNFVNEDTSENSSKYFTKSK